MTNPTDTNQASDEELRNDIISILRYSELDIVDDADAIMHLITAEKTKLLDEVIHQSTVNLKSARAVAGWAEIRKKQLEAEL